MKVIGLYRRYWTSAIALSALLLAGCSSSGSGTGGKASAGKAEPAAAPVAVTIEGIAKEYAANEGEADKKYKDKLVEFEGVVFVPADKSLTLATVMLKDPTTKDQTKGLTLRWTPQASLRDKAKELKSGQKAKLKGKFAGKTGDFVDVIEGEIVEIGPAPKE